MLLQSTQMHYFTSQKQRGIPGNQISPHRQRARFEPDPRRATAAQPRPCLPTRIALRTLSAPNASPERPGRLPRRHALRCRTGFDPLDGRRPVLVQLCRAASNVTEPHEERHDYHDCTRRRRANKQANFVMICEHAAVRHSHLVMCTKTKRARGGNSNTPNENMEFIVARSTMDGAVWRPPRNALSDPATARTAGVPTTRSSRRWHGAREKRLKPTQRISISIPQMTATEMPTNIHSDA